MCLGNLHLETGHFGPATVPAEQRVGTDIKRRCGAELTPPPPHGAHVSKLLVQYVRHHAQHVRQIAVLDLIFEVSDDNVPEVFAHSYDTDGFAPTNRSRPG